MEGGEINGRWRWSATDVRLIGYMDLFYIDLKSYRRRYNLAVVVEGFAIMGCYLAPRYFVSAANPALVLSRTTVNILLIVLFILAFGHGRIQKKRLAYLRSLNDFEQKSALYEKLFAFRLDWFLITCLLSCIFYFLTWRNLFFYFAIFDMVLTVPCFPNKTLIRKEMDNDEIAFD
jgi:hypothetical protein